MAKSKTTTPKKAKVGQTKDTGSSTVKSLAMVVTPFTPGVSFVALTEAGLLPIVHANFVAELSTGGGRFPIPGPEDMECITTIVSGSNRAQEQARGMAMAASSSRAKVKNKFEFIPARVPIDWCSDAGFIILSNLIADTKGVITIEQVIPKVDVFIVDGLKRIHEAAIQADAVIIFFIVCPDKCEKTNFDKIFGDYLEVNSCQPDPYSYSAFSIDAVALSHMNPLGVGKVMCAIKLIDGRFRRSFTPYISDDLEIRNMWILKGHGLSYQKVADALAVEKTKVWRSLQGLPPPKKVNLPANWLDAYQDLAEIIMDVEDEDEEAAEDLAEQERIDAVAKN